MKKTILLLVLVMLTLAGCSSSSSSSKTSGISGDSFRGGSQGLTFDFVENAPPEKIRDQGLQPFSVRILVKNEGEADIKENQAYVNLNGIDPQLFGLEDTSKEVLAINGFKKQGSNTIPGGQQYVTFSNLKYLETLAGQYSLKMFADICYPYQTKSIVNMCVSGNTLPSIDEKAQICEVDSKRDVFNSGAPVSVENVVQYPYGESSIQIQFDIVHKPTSDYANIYESSSIDENCKIHGSNPTSPDVYQYLDRVKYTVETNIVGLKCGEEQTNTGFVTLNENKNTVICIQDTTGEQEYEKPITITLDYDYFDRKSKTITVDHIQR